MLSVEQYYKNYRYYKRKAGDRSFVKTEGGPPQILFSKKKKGKIVFQQKRNRNLTLNTKTPVGEAWLCSAVRSEPQKVCSKMLCFYFLLS